MLAGDLRVRAARLEAEQMARVEKEKQRIQKERILRERQQARERAREEEKRQARLQAIAAQQAEEERVEEEREANRGVFFEAMLQAAPLDEAASAAKGIRRAKDKVVLPPSVSTTLLNQDAQRNGAMLFEISTPWGTRTHAGGQQARAGAALPARAGAAWPALAAGGQASREGCWGPGADAARSCRALTRRQERKQLELRRRAGLHGAGGRGAAAQEGQPVPVWPGGRRGRRQGDRALQAAGEGRVRQAAAQVGLGLWRPWCMCACAARPPGGPGPPTRAASLLPPVVPEQPRRAARRPQAAQRATAPLQSSAARVITAT
jgi:hypothetical protein